MWSKVKKNYPVIIWSLSVIFLFYKYLLEVSPSVMADTLMKELHINGAQLGNIAACYYYAYLIMQIPTGLMIDKFGPRRIASVAIAFCGVGTYILATAHTGFMAGTARFITGLGAVSAVIACLKLTTLWFEPRRFAMLAGLMMSFGMLGAVAGQAPLSFALTHYGWQYTLYGLSATGAVLALIYFTIVRDHGKYEVNTSNEPVKVLSGLKRILTNKQSWIISVYSGLAFAPVSAFAGLWGVPFLMDSEHISRTQAASEVSLIFIGFAIGAPISGWLSDRVGKRLPLMILGTFISLIMICMIIYIPNLSSITMIVLMFTFGFFISFFLICFSIIREVNGLLLAATAIGFMNSFDALIGGVSDPLLGYLLDLGWGNKTKHGVMTYSLQDYHFAMSLLPLFLLASLILLFFTKETHCKLQR